MTTVGPGVAAARPGAAGVGNGDGDGTEGAWSGRVVGTYLHGPVLARNPALADVLLGWAIGPTTGPAARRRGAGAAPAERLATVRRATRGSWFRAGGRRGD